MENSDSDECSVDEEENNGCISRERSLVGTPVVKTRIKLPDLYTPQTKKDRENRHKRAITSTYNDGNDDDDLYHVISSDDGIRTSQEKATTSTKSSRPTKNKNNELNTAKKENDDFFDQMCGLSTELPENSITETPSDLTVDLMLHQKQGLNWMKKRESEQFSPGGILADDMGLGKTLSMISLIVSQNDDQIKVPEIKEKIKAKMENEFSSKNILPAYCTLIVTPASVLYQWEKEAKDRVKNGTLKIHIFHGPKRENDPQKLIKNDVVITTFHIISNELNGGNDDDDDDDDIEWTPGYERKKTSDKDFVLNRIGWERIILDEGHNIKNRNSLTSKGCCNLHALRRWIVTGTPIHNQLWDFYSLVKFLRIVPFCNEDYWKKHIIADEGGENLKLLVKKLVLRRTKNQICPFTNKPLVNLKPRRINTIEVQLEGAELQYYRQLEKSFKSKVGQITKSNRKKNKKNCLLVLLLRLRQACVHMALTKHSIDLKAFIEDGSEGIEDVIDEIETSFGDITLETESTIDQENDEREDIFDPAYESAKLKVLLQKINEIIKSDDKCVIISQWTSMLDIVKQHLNRKKIKFTTIDGKIKTKARQRNVELFNQIRNGPKIMLLSLAAGGVGLNLVGGNHLFLLDSHWNPALEQQAMDRIYRVGQTKNVFIYKLVCKNTVEDMVLKLQNKKMELASSVIGNVTNSTTKLNLDEIKFLFGINT